MMAKTPRKCIPLTVDTGSTYNLLSYKVLMELIEDGVTFDIVDSDIKLQIANGTEIEAAGQIKFTLNFGPEDITIICLIVPNLIKDTIILGRAFLQMTKATINFAKGTMEIEPQLEQPDFYNIPTRPEPCPATQYLKNLGFNPTSEMTVPIVTFRDILPNGKVPDSK